MAVIAVVDDDLSVRRAMKRLLGAVGHDVRLFEGGAEFLGSLERERPACIVLDGQMPGMDGTEVLTRLSRHPDRVPVIVVTGHDSPEYRRVAAGHGVVAFFPKPFNPEGLLTAIASAVNRRQG